LFFYNILQPYTQVHYNGRWTQDLNRFHTIICYLLAILSRHVAYRYHFAHV